VPPWFPLGRSVSSLTRARASGSRVGGGTGNCLKRRTTGYRRCMPELVLGPVLRYVEADEATVGVETDSPCGSRCPATETRRSPAGTTMRSSVADPVVAENEHVGLGHYRITC
jgi:hypothetical protein